MNQKYFQGAYPILKKDNLARNVYSFEVLAKEIAEAAQPGQFVHIKAEGFFLRRPISLCEISAERGTVRIVFEIRGEGTRMLAGLQEGSMLDIIGPLGKGFTMLEPEKEALLIGGGIGLPPLLEVAKHYGMNSTVISGFRTAGSVILNTDFKHHTKQVMVCTDDGTMGAKGNVLAAFNFLLQKKRPVDILYACGPHPMLKGVVEVAKEAGIRCEVSLEERMGCGVGACLVCACKTVKSGQEYFAHVCKDGPVFPADEIVWE